MDSFDAFEALKKVYKCIMHCLNMHPHKCHAFKIATEEYKIICPGQGEGK